MIQTKTTPFILSPLPYDQNALAPIISAETISYHYDKHHRGYLDKLNELVSGTEMEGLGLEALIIKTAGNVDKTAIFNNASQVWNHDFYWGSLSPDGGGIPTGELGRKIESDFGGYKNFLKQFIELGTGSFGSGWVWLVEENGALKIKKTSNAESPLSQKQGKALLVLDLWEHAYYLDYQNRRMDYLRAIMDKLIDWRFAEINLADNTIFPL